MGHHRRKGRLIKRMMYRISLPRVAGIIRPIHAIAPQSLWPVEFIGIEGTLKIRKAIGMNGTLPRWWEPWQMVNPDGIRFHVEAAVGTGGKSAPSAVKILV